MKIYNKLIRDNIPSIMSAQGKNFRTHVAEPEEYKVKLKEKLIEEVNEFLEDPCLEELADILEVFSALVDAMGYSQEELAQRVNEKSDERGSFESRIVLESVEE
jgi:predicted house-cleaning noncanonical NTP pyrophosphatase (MazG superfamily)